jgi:chromosome segregation ATPase
LSKSLLQESLKSAEEVCAERDDLIQQLKCSLRDALQNALQADASKRESEDKLAEIAETLSQYEQVEHDESESIVSGGLSGSLHPKSTIERLVFDKQELEVNLAQSERQLLECQSALSGLEAKLSMAEQMNERLQEEAIACEHQMNKLAAENKERLADQNWMEDRIRRRVKLTVKLFRGCKWSFKGQKERKRSWRKKSKFSYRIAKSKLSTRSYLTR